MSQSAIDRAVLRSLLDSLYELSKTTENYLKQAAKNRQKLIKSKRLRQNRT